MDVAGPIHFNPMANKNFCESPKCEMHTFVLHVGLRGKHSDETLDAIKADIADFLKRTPEDDRNIKEWLPH